MASTKASFNWEDPLLLDLQLSETERMVRDAARAYCQDKLMPRVQEAFRPSPPWGERGDGFGTKSPACGSKPRSMGVFSPVMSSAQRAGLTRDETSLRVNHWTSQGRRRSTGTKLSRRRWPARG